MKQRTQEDVAVLLEEAADLLFTQGWCQRALHQSGPSGVERCGIAAVQDAAQSFPAGTAYDAVKAVARHLGSGSRNCADRFMRWNDTRGRTADEVIDVLRHTAKDVRSGEIALEWW